MHGHVFDQAHDKHMVKEDDTCCFAQLDPPDLTKKGIICFFPREGAKVRGSDGNMRKIASGITITVEMDMDTMTSHQTKHWYTLESHLQDGAKM